jgi:hypothetical protein
MATYGFENHTGDAAMASIKGFRHRVGSTEDEAYEVATLVVRPSITQPDMVQVQMLSTVTVPGISVGGYLNRREAIYLRNRLTAFIEQGLDTPEDV